MAEPCDVRQGTLDMLILKANVIAGIVSEVNPSALTCGEREMDGELTFHIGQQSRIAESCDI